MSHHHADTEQDFELNLAPIIDCFVVLITYLLVTASFLALGSLDVTLPNVADSANGEVAGSEPGLNLRLHLRGDGGIDFGMATANGGQGEHERISLEQLAKRIAVVKASARVPEGVVFSADPAVRYRDVVKVVEIARAGFPGVALTRLDGGGQ